MESANRGKGPAHWGTPAPPSLDSVGLEVFRRQQQSQALEDETARRMRAFAGTAPEVRAGWPLPSQSPDVQSPPRSAETRPPAQQESPPRQEPFRFRPEDIAKMQAGRNAARLGGILLEAQTAAANAQTLPELIASQKKRNIGPTQMKLEMDKFIKRQLQQVRNNPQGIRRFQTPAAIKAQIDSELFEEKQQDLRRKQEAINRKMRMGGAAGLGLAALGGLGAYGLMRLFGGEKKEEKKAKKKADKPRRPSRGRRGRSGRSAYKKGGVVKKTGGKN